MTNPCRIQRIKVSRIAAGFFCLLISPAWVSARCPPRAQTEAGLLALKKSEFLVVEDRARQTLALGLLPCLSSPNPLLRDGIAFEAISIWLRKDQLNETTRHEILEKLQLNLNTGKPDKAGFSAPFSALVLSEVARTDRIKAWMTPEQRMQLVKATAGYMTGIQDYRGFDDKQGWRHAVAHTSDLVMQLALNPAVDKAQMDLLLDATTTQIGIAEHSYIHGEPERLLRAVLYIAKRDVHAEKDWQDWMENLMKPAPLTKWDDAFASSEGLAKRHNLQAFLLVLHANTLQSDDKNWKLLNRLSMEALKKLP